MPLRSTGAGGLILPEEGSTPATPPAGTGRIWMGPNGQVHFQNDAGVDVEPYSDVNPPQTLQMSDQGTTPPNPPAGQSTLYSPDGKSLRMRDSDGTEVTIGPSSGGSAALGSIWTNRERNIAGVTSRALTAANQLIYVHIVVGAACTLTGIRYRKGSGTTAGNVIFGLFDASGTRVAVTGTFAQGTTANGIKKVPFSSAYSAAAGIYWVGMLGSATAVDYYGAGANEYFGPTTTVTAGSFAMPASFTPPAMTDDPVSTLIPMLATY